MNLIGGSRTNTKDLSIGSNNRVNREKPLADGCFYSFRTAGGNFYLTLDPDHAFYREIYQPLKKSDSEESEKLQVLIELLLLAAARSEARVSPQDAGAITKAANAVR